MPKSKAKKENWNEMNENGFIVGIYAGSMIAAIFILMLI